jgi:hypothetical protein
MSRPDRPARSAGAGYLSTVRLCVVRVRVGYFDTVNRESTTQP